MIERTSDAKGCKTTLPLFLRTLFSTQKRSIQWNIPNITVVYLALDKIDWIWMNEGKLNKRKNLKNLKRTFCEFYGWVLLFIKVSRVRKTWVYWSVRVELETYLSKVRLTAILKFNLVRLSSKKLLRKLKFKPRSLIKAILGHFDSHFLLVLGPFPAYSFSFPVHFFEPKAP